ncbi:5,6-dimethylbenzimidazole synthase [Albirhodobacter sp. R86504]|uniref:5,6-dimethylbenzimidazole synthase n=1 Tax=Albirhodobacter sp. R86504 TaxID=3093848 RepID=UPI00366B49A3
MEFSSEQALVLREILRWRRDVRHFRTDPVEEETLRMLIAVMAAAPSVGNARPWRVVRVRDKALRGAVRAEFERCNSAALETYSGERAETYAGLKLAGLDAAPEQFAIFTDMEPEAGHRLGRATMAETLRQSTAMAIHTLWLAARAENLGMGMVSIVDPERMEQIFDVHADWEFSAYLCIGHPEFKDDTPLLHRAGWQENAPTLWDDR